MSVFDEKYVKPFLNKVIDIKLKSGKTMYGKVKKVEQDHFILDMKTKEIKIQY